MIEVITFDLWNTLIHNKSYKNVRLKFLQEFLENKGINNNLSEIDIKYEDTFHRFNYDSQLDKHQHIYNKHRLENFFKSYGLNINSLEMKKLTKNLERNMLGDPPLLKEGAYEVLKSLSSEYKVGLISDTGVTPGKIIKKVLENYDILKFFNVTIFSDEVGYYKPNPIIFDITLKKLRGTPEKAVHVGDLLETDIKGAKNIGMYAIWIKNNYYGNEKEINPDFTISSLFEVPNCIDEINQK